MNNFHDQENIDDRKKKHNTTSQEMCDCAEFENLYMTDDTVYYKEFENSVINVDLEEKEASSTANSSSLKFNERGDSKRKLNHMFRKTRNWLNGFPNKHLDKYNDFDSYFESSLQQLSELGSSSCSHKQVTSSFTLKRLANEEVSLPSSSKYSRLSSERDTFFRTIHSCKSEMQTSFCSNEVHSTKYNIFTFIPKNLYEQFHRIANIYFLMLVIFQFIPQISSYNPLLSAAPLLFIIIITGLKDGVEDWRRYKSDKLINASLATILEYQFEGIYKKQKSKWKDIKVGDLIYLCSGDSIPADCVVLSSSSSDVYLDTMSLDGETSLKLKRTIPMQFLNIPIDEKPSFQLEVEFPTPHLYSFKGQLFIDEGCYFDEDGEKLFTEIPLSIDNVLLRGCVLRNTDWVIGIVIYTGYETKIMLNSISHSNGPHASVKRSTIERQLNRQIILNFFLLIILCLICMSAESFSVTSTKKLLKTTTVKSAFISFFKSLILFQTVVPIALYITVEMCKTFHAFLIHSDEEMKDPISGKQCNARAWNLSDDLGRVKFIFSDKTGTLTRNVMEFKYFNIRGETYSLEREISKADYDSFYFKHMMLAIALCHSVHPSSDINETSSNSSSDLLTIFHNNESSSSKVPQRNEAFDSSRKIEYLGESPDEVALVTACSKMGYRFIGISFSPISTIASIFINVNFIGTSGIQNNIKIIENYEILLTIPFSSDRQRMSVVIKKNENIFLLCKGSDSMILSRCQNGASDEAWMFNSLEKIEIWASQGLRVLCFAMKDLTNRNEEWIEWLSKYHDVKKSISPNDSVLLESLYSELEFDLEFLGVSAIEDALQEGVPDTIEALREARICTWVLTGDKAETAINVSTSAGLINSKMRMFELYFPAPRLKQKGFSNSRSSSILNDDKKERDSISSCDRSECAVRSSLLKIIKNFDNSETKYFANENESCPHISPTMDDLSSKSPSLYFELVEASSASPYFHFYSTKTPCSKLSSLSSNVKSIEDYSPKSILSTHFEGSALVIDGLSLKYIFESSDPSFKTLFLSVAIRCSSVICCRVAPLQKAKIVDLVKEFISPAVCLSIGDGANDVSMLRIADVGIGISTGKEGCQAVMAADYSIAQFSHLKRLLLVHGRWCYHRISSATLCCFYKNIAFVFILFWYQFDCAFSSQFIYDYAFLLFYNFLFSVLPVLSVGIFDRDIESNVALLFPCMYTGGNKVPKCTLSQPHSHSDLSKNELPFDPIFKPISYYSIERFLIVICEGLYQSLICYLIPRFVFSGGPLNTLLIYSNDVSWIPIPEDRTVVGSTMGFCIIISVNLTILLHHYSWNLIALGSITASMLLLFGMFFIMSSWTTSTLYGTPWILFFHPAFYYCLLCCITLCLFPRLTFGYINTLRNPDSVHILNHILFSMKNRRMPLIDL